MYFDTKSWVCFLTIFATINGSGDIHEKPPNIGLDLDPQLDPKIFKTSTKGNLGQINNENVEISKFCFHKFFLRPTVPELLTILMIRRCKSWVHPLIIKIANNSETVSRRKNLWKQKLLISTFYHLIASSFIAKINGFGDIYENHQTLDSGLTLNLTQTFRNLILR